MKKILFSRNGTSSYANNGLKMTIIDYRKNNDFDVQFEDGTIVFCKRYRSFIDGSIAHPTFSSRGHGKLNSFIITEKAFELIEPDKKFYFCQCTKCNLKDILSPRQMLAHHCNH